jgi:hypothetical protein
VPEGIVPEALGQAWVDGAELGQAHPWGGRGREREGEGERERWKGRGGDVICEDGEGDVEMGQAGK